MFCRHLWPRLLPLEISGCGDTLWSDVELHLGSGSLTSSASVPLYSAASPFCPGTQLCCWRGWSTCPLGNHFFRPDDMWTHVAGNPGFGVQPSTSQSQVFFVFKWPQGAFFRSEPAPRHARHIWGLLRLASCCWDCGNVFPVAPGGRKTEAGPVREAGAM